MNNGTSTVGIPPYIQERLDQPPAGKGGRHQDILDLSAMMTGERIPDDEQFVILRNRYPDKDKSDQELWEAIKGAHDRGFKPAETSSRPLSYRRESGSRLEVKNGKATLTLSNQPAGDVPEGRAIKPIDFLRMAFKPGELVCLCNETVERNGKATIANHGNFRTIEEWGEKFTEFGENMLDGDAGCWIRINPFKPDTKEGDDKSVADFRNLLVEFDGRPKAEQYKIYKESGLPIRFVIDSGGDSLHAWIAVNASSYEEFKTRQERVYEFLEAYLDDKGNKNPSRFSRLPGVERREKGDGTYQMLVAENLGASSWQEWEDENTDDGFDFDDMAGELAEALPEPKHLVQGCICKGDVVILGGPSKSFKTWTVMELAAAVSQGTKFLKWECNQGRVFMVDTEMKRKRFNDRFKSIARARGESIDPDDIGRLLLRGKKMAVEDLVPLLIRRLKGKNYDMILIDSIYLLLGKREENSNEDISDLGVWLHKLAVELDVAVVFTHHFSKGSQTGKRGIEKFSGAGAWGRFVDAAISIDANPETDCFNLEPDFRDFAKQSPFVIRRNGPTWTIDGSVKVASKANATEKGGLDDVLDILANECGGECSPGEWFEACKAKLGITSRTTFGARKAKALKAGLIEQAGDTKNTVCRLLAVKDPTTMNYRVRTSTIEVDGGKVTFEQE